jgi:hypothetical protein
MPVTSLGVGNGSCRSYLQMFVLGHGGLAVATVTRSRQVTLAHGLPAHSVAMTQRKVFCVGRISLSERYARIMQGISPLAVVTMAMIQLRLAKIKSPVLY